MTDELADSGGHAGFNFHGECLHQWEVAISDHHPTVRGLRVVLRCCQKCDDFDVQVFDWALVCAPPEDDSDVVG